jgi:hypothetical protein
MILPWCSWCFWKLPWVWLWRSPVWWPSRFYIWFGHQRSLVMVTTIQFALHLLHTLTSQICAWHYCFIDHFTLELELEPTFCSCVHLTIHKERIAVDAKVWWPLWTSLGKRWTHLPFGHYYSTTILVGSLGM